jgi:prevent-host-death family protein
MPNNPETQSAPQPSMQNAPASPWQLQTAKARFSEVFRLARSEGPQRITRQGKEGVIGMLSAGEFIGEGCLAGQPLHLASASATAESAIVRIEKEAMIRALRDEPTFSQLFMAYLLSRNVQIEADLVDQLFNSSEKRLARVLLLLAHFGKDGKLVYYQRAR